MTKVHVNYNSKFGNVNWNVGDYFKHTSGEIYIVARVAKKTSLICLNNGGYWGTCDGISGNAEDLEMGEDQFTPIDAIEISIC